MRIGAALTVTVLCLIGGCSAGVQPEASAIDAADSVCAIPGLPEGKHVRIRGLYTVHAHGYFLRDERCPGYMLTLTQAPKGPDISLCTPEELARVFGCPGGNDNGPVVTVSGVLGSARTPTVREVTVERFSDFENVRSRERVTP